MPSIVKLWIGGIARPLLLQAQGLSTTGYFEGCSSREARSGMNKSVAVRRRLWWIL